MKFYVLFSLKNCKKKMRMSSATVLLSNLMVNVNTYVCDLRFISILFETRMLIRI